MTSCQQQHDAQIEVCNRIVRLQPQRRTVIRFRLVEPAQFLHHPGQVANGRWIAGRPAHRLAQRYRRILQPPRLPQRRAYIIVDVGKFGFQPQGIAAKSYAQRGEIPLGPLQIARMDNDPSYPNHGRLTLVMKGGK